MYKYLKISTSDTETSKETEEKLKFIYASVGVFDSPIDIFSVEEAERRVSKQETIKGHKISPKIREVIVTEVANDINEDSNYINSDTLEAITVNVINTLLPLYYVTMSEARIEIEKLVEEDYAVRNENPHFMISDGEVHLYSYIKEELMKDSSFNIKNWDLTPMTARLLMLKYGFKEIKPCKEEK